MDEKDFEKLKKDLRKLKGNREKVGEAVLRSRYGPAYRRLLEEIRHAAQTMAKDILFGGLEFREQDIGSEGFQAFIENSNQIIKEEAEAFRAYSRDIFRGYDICAAAGRLGRVALRIEYEAYGLHYWLRHCRTVDDRIWNDIIRMWWEPAEGVWAIRENGNSIRWRYLPPPTEELIREKLAELKKGGDS